MHQHVSVDAQDSRGNRTRLLVAFALAASVVVAQAVGALVTGSLALLTDTFHAAVDSLGLFVALVAATLMLRPANARRTWGFARLEVLAATLQAAILLVVGIFTVIEGVRRLVAPPEVPGDAVIWFGAIGLVANVAAIAVLHGRRGDNLNMRAAFLEVVNDALGSLAVIAAGLAIRLWGVQRADAIAALIIAALILPRAVLILRDTFRILMEFAPAGLDMDAVRHHIVRVEGVVEVHDLHASMIGTGLPVLQAHVVVEESVFADGSAPALLERIQSCLAEHFPISVQHTTIQLEPPHHQRQEPSMHGSARGTGH